MASEELKLSDYLTIARQRAPYLIGTFVLVMAITLVVIIFAPRTFRSTATIMVDSQVVPQNVIPNQSSQTVDERIQSIEKRVLTRESLLGIANKDHVFSGDSRFLTSSDLVRKMRDSVSVELININTVQGVLTGKVTIAFSLSFAHRNPQIAYQVTKDLADLFMAWNVRLQTESATDTTIFLAQAADKQKQEVERINGLITVYKKQHSEALPELADLHMAIMQDDQRQLQELDRRYSELQARLAGTKNGDASETSLPALKARLARLSLIYNDSYPDIQALKLKIAALENGASTSGVKRAKSDGADAAPADDTLESLARQRRALRDRIVQEEATIMRTPEVAQGLRLLVSQRDNAEQKYEEILNKQQNAQLTEQMRRENKGERFTLLEPPVMPDKPFKPKPVKIMAMGFFLAIASSGGMLAAMGALDNKIRGAGALEDVIGASPLAIVPYLVLEEELTERKRKIKIAIIALAVAFILAILAIQFFYMPLNELMLKILGKIMT